MLMIDGFNKATSRTKEMKWKNTLAAVFDVGLHFKEDIIAMFSYEGASLISHRMAACY